MDGTAQEFSTKAEELVDKYARLVYQLAFARTRSKEAAEDSAGLNACLDRLSPELRTIVHLYYYEGYSSPEIAALLGKGESAVRMALMRARRQLRNFLEEGGNPCV